MNKLYRGRQVLRFRRWSRKAYAVFCSLGKCVTIGTLKKGIADVSLGKQANVCTSGAVCLPVVEDKTEDEAEEALNPFENLLQLFSVRSQAATESAHAESVIYILRMIPPKECFMHSFGFFCVFTQNKKRC